MIEYRIPNQFTRRIDETEELRLEYEFESTYLVQKSNNQILMYDDFIGDPECGLIDKQNNWAIVAGTHLTLWKPNCEKRYYTDKFQYIHSVRLKKDEIVEILIDPWADFSAIWELNVETEELNKISDFRKYQDKKYTENVEW